MASYSPSLALALLLVACTGSDPNTPNGSNPGQDGWGDGNDSSQPDGDGGGNNPGNQPGNGGNQGGGGDGQGGGGQGGGGQGGGGGGGGVVPPVDGYVTEGVVVPNHKTREQLVAETVEFYRTFKDNFIEPACEPGHYRVRTAGDTHAYTVSEAHGYGMLFTVMMADHDPEAQKIFDGMADYAAEHGSWTGIEGLMAWAQDRDCEDIQGGNAATDGDLDIAYALLVADKVWGSQGRINYREQALWVMRGILDGEIADENHIMIGDWVGDPHWQGTRPSDWMTSHLKSFAKVSGEARWNAIVDRTYEIAKHVQDDDSPSGLLPDFVHEAHTNDPYPAWGGWLEGEHDGDYGYNACRVPWRIGTDYVLFGDERARAIVRKLNAFIRQATGDNPGAIVDGYYLDGRPYGSWSAPAFVAPFMVSAMVEPEEGTNQAWINALWDQVTGMEPGGYYSDSIKLATMMVVSGLWKAP